MRQVSIAVVIVLATTSWVSADDAHKAWFKFFAGSWEISGAGPVAQMKFEAAAKGSAVIGTAKNSEGLESAWILGWDGAEKRMIHAWFGENGEHGRVRYELVDENTLRGPGSYRSSDGVMKGTVTVKKTGENRYTVQWSEVTVDGNASDDLNLVVERK